MVFLCWVVRFNCLSVIIAKAHVLDLLPHIYIDKLEENV